MALLEISGISKHFGGISALDEATFNVEPGEALALVGPNGAGKTTLIECVSGLLRPDAGRVVFAGQDLESVPPHARCWLGMRRTFQKVELFAGLSVREHVLLAQRSSQRSSGTFLPDLLGLSYWSAAELEAADEALRAVGLDQLGDEPVETLDLGHGRLLELARALVGTPRLLLLDEPSSGLHTQDIESFARLVDHLCHVRGVAVLLVEHDLDLVTKLADTVVVLDFGRVIADGPVGEVMEDPQVRRAYLGESVSGESSRDSSSSMPQNAGNALGRRERFMEAPALEFSNVDASYGPYRALFDVSFSVEAGSVTALLGPNGAGKTTVARVAAGLVQVSSGSVAMAGKEVHSLRAWQIARLGAVMLPEGRSVFQSLTVEENLALAFGRGFSRASRRAAIERSYELFARLRERRAQLAGNLSGGEQRMLALARVLGSPPKLLVADELSLGLAPHITDEVFEALGAIREQGSTILLIEQHVERALGLADYVVRLNQGRVRDVGPVAEMAPLLRAGLAS